MANQKITIKDIAQMAGVSISTVSRALNNTGRIDQKTKERINQIIDDVGYRPNMAAQGLKTQKTRNIMLVVPDITNPFYSNMAKCLQIFTKKKNYILTLYNTNEDLPEELRAIATAKEICAGGIIFASVNTHQTIIDALLDVNVPTVLLNSYDACEFDTVHGKRGLGTYISTQYLINNGHKRIAFVGGWVNSTIGKSRKKGYVKALKEAGITFDEKLLFEMGFSEDTGYKAGKYFTSLANPPSAICCANDIIAMGVLSALQEANMSVPEEMSITGMDDIIYSRISNPPLTTVTNDYAAFAKHSFEMLIERIDGNYNGKPREIVLDRELVVRESVMPFNSIPTGMKKTDLNNIS